MKIIKLNENIPDLTKSVVSVGNFDGIHLGHQAVIGQLAEEAADLCLPSMLISFEPQPMEYFQPDKAPARLTRLREKLQALRRFSVDQVLCFNAEAFENKLRIREIW